MMVIAIDFDGVISKYNGFVGKGNFGEEIDGAKESINHLKLSGNTIIIYTTRLEIHQVKEYLDEVGILYDHINCNPQNEVYMLHPSKIRADIYIDDRAIKFEGNWSETLSEVENFREWWRQSII